MEKLCGGRGVAGAKHCDSESCQAWQPGRARAGVGKEEWKHVKQLRLRHVSTGHCCLALGLEVGDLLGMEQVFLAGAVLSFGQELKNKIRLPVTSQVL